MSHTTQPPLLASDTRTANIATRAHHAAINDNALPVWTVYEGPKDFPNRVIARLHLVRAGLHYPTVTAIAGETVEEVRRCLPEGLINFGRSPDDAPQIVECWL